MNFDFLDEGGAGNEDLFDIIGCDETASTEQIKAEYRHRVRKLHPDKVEPGDVTAQGNYERYN